MGFFGAYSAYQVGDKKSVWDLRDYGFSGLWVKRASTVALLISDLLIFKESIFFIP
jgi:hypothetical protein